VTLPAELGRDLDPARALLEETIRMVLATRMPDGSPRATPVFFATDERLRLIDNRRGFGFQQEWSLA
jgi:hypothetical protein